MKQLRERLRAGQLAAEGEDTGAGCPATAAAGKGERERYGEKDGSAACHGARRNRGHDERDHPHERRCCDHRWERTCGNLRCDRGHSSPSGPGPVLHTAAEPGCPPARGCAALPSGRGRWCRPAAGAGRLPAAVPDHRRHWRSGRRRRHSADPHLPRSQAAQAGLLPDLLRQPHPQLRAVVHDARRQQRRQHPAARVGIHRTGTPAGLGRRRPRLRGAQVRVGRRADAGQGDARRHPRHRELRARPWKAHARWSA